MISSIIKFIKLTKMRCAIWKSRPYKVGRYTITLPPKHKLDVYQHSFNNYDKKLPAIARMVESKYSVMSVIDIGANIGDTAFALRDACDAPLICIEGNPKFIPLLETNISKLPGVIRVVPKFIGPESFDNLGNVVTVNGTAHFDRESAHDSHEPQRIRIAVITYKELLASIVDLPEVRLVKIDTDGFDFRIIAGSIDQMAASLPVLFFEFDPSFSPKNDKYEALGAMAALNGAGYLHYVIYDNYGNYIFSFSEHAAERFEDLFCFLEQSRNSGGRIEYLDACCFAEKDKDIFLQLVATERGRQIKCDGEAEV
jgi:FkbM family methyltransferase